MMMMVMMMINKELRKSHRPSIVWEKKTEKARDVHILHMSIKLEKLKRYSNHPEQ